MQRSEHERALWHALADRTDQLERLLVRVGQLVGALCMLVSAFVTVGMRAPMGPALLALSMGTLALYSVAAATWDRSDARGVFRWILPVFEAVLPALVVLVMNRTQGPAYALGSWVPPQLGAIFIFVSLLRLRQDVPVLIGTVTAATYLGVVYADVGFPNDGNLLHQPSMQWVRAVSLVLTGVASSLVVRALRRSIDAADRTVREKELFGKYRIGRDIASGGMGRVVEALYCPEGGFERRVAIKLVHPHLAKDPTFVDRFRVEAELCSRLHHPGIVAALDFGRAGDTWFFAMEYVDGRPLQDILKDYRTGRTLLAPRVVVALGLQLTDALDHAHAHAADSQGRLLRVLHRDLTPSNVLLDRSGQFKLSDFGVARAMGDDDSLRTRNLVGKPSYVAPEVLRDQLVDERSDLWSLAVVLFEALTNFRLFKRGSDAATLLAVLEHPVPTVGTYRIDCSPRWQPFFERALARDPAHRYPSAEAMHAALMEIQADEGRATSEEIAAMLGFGEEELPLEHTETGEVSGPAGGLATDDPSG